MMERLTLDEAIKHAKEVADMNYNDAGKFDSNDSVENYMKANCMKCAEQHEKLAEWLEELKSYKEAEEQGLFMRLPANNKEIYIISSRWTVCSGAVQDLMNTVVVAVNTNVIVKKNIMCVQLIFRL